MSALAGSVAALGAEGLCSADGLLAGKMQQSIALHAPDHQNTMLENSMSQPHLEIAANGLLFPYPVHVSVLS